MTLVSKSTCWPRSSLVRDHLSDGANATDEQNVEKLLAELTRAGAANVRVVLASGALALARDGTIKPSKIMKAKWRRPRARADLDTIRFYPQGSVNVRRACAGGKQAQP
jgi:hypothetical protein